MHKITFTVKDLEGFSFSVDSGKSDGYGTCYYCQQRYRQEELHSEYTGTAAAVTTISVCEKCKNVKFFGFGDDELSMMFAVEGGRLQRNPGGPDEMPTAIVSPDESGLPMTPKDRRDLINEMAQKPAQMLTQIDWFEQDTGMGQMFGGTSIEFRKSECMRLHVPAYFTQEAMIAGLTEMLEWVKASGEKMQSDTREAAVMHNERYLDAINPYADYADAVSADNDDDVRPF